MDDLIIGTAGHVDHGKTVLIKALTGHDTDRLQEEKERGISIDLGFAPFRLPGGRLAGIVDVPGHEGFIHNMLAGAAGIDLVLLVVDAGEGVMPQTREHLDILQLLGIKNGVVVITKIDLVENEWRELVQEEIREELAGTFLEEAPIIAVSALKGQGMEELKQLIDRQTAQIEPRSAAGPLRLPVDRSFVISGFGTVVTGTLAQGSVKVGDTVEVVPPGLEARVRNIQVHDDDLKEARAGTRVALNLSGLEKSQVLRGSVVSSPGYYRETGLLDVALELLPRSQRPLKNGDPLHFFLGTARSVARAILLDRDELKPGQNGLVQCRLDRPLVAERGDPFVIRSYSPMTTIGGGIILDPYPARHRRFRTEVIKTLEELKSAPTSAGGDAVFLRQKLQELVVADSGKLAKETRLDKGKVESLLAELVRSGRVINLGESYFPDAIYKQLVNTIKKALEDHHLKQPLSKGLSRSGLKNALPAAVTQRDYDALLKELQDQGLITFSGDRVSIFGFSPSPSPADRKLIDRLAAVYHSAGLQPPSVRDAFSEAAAPPERKDELLSYLQGEGLLSKVGDDLYFHGEAYQKALVILKEHFKNEDKITLAQFRDLTGGSRKYAQALLEHFDNARYTRRVEDHRVPFKLER